MPFSGSEVSEKGFPSGWEAPAEDLASQRVFRITRLLEAMVFRPFSWDRFNSLNLKYAFHGGYIDAGDKWLLIDNGFVTLVEGSKTNFIERSDAGQVTVNQDKFSYPESIPMAEIKARNGSFVERTYIDRRPEIGGAPTGGGGALATRRRHQASLCRVSRSRQGSSDIDSGLCRGKPRYFGRRPASRRCRTSRRRAATIDARARSLEARRVPRHGGSS